MQKRRSIVLIGMPGAGKSTLGVVMAKIWGMDFLDGDLLIQHEYDQTLQQIINERGTDGFIKVEGDVLSSINDQNAIISTGGSAIYSHDAMLHLAEVGTVVFLDISYDELVRRLGDLQERGVVMKDGIGMSLSALYDERQPLYQRYADVTVDVNGLTITEAAHKVIAAVCELRGEELPACIEADEAARQTRNA